MIRVFNDFYNFLDGTGAMRVTAKANGVWLNCLNYLPKLIVRATFGYLLSKIVSERIIHNLHEASYCMIKYYLLKLWIVLLNFLLKETASTLIFGEKI